MATLQSNDVSQIKNYLTRYGLEVRDDKIVPSNETRSLWKDYVDSIDKRQLVRKILLNSAFSGALSQ
jgi:hypothetical protein